MVACVHITTINGGEIVRHYKYIFDVNEKLQRVYLYRKSHVMLNNQSNNVHFLFNKGTCFSCKYLILNTPAQEKVSMHVSC